ncbi:MAG: vWA domain-containing protein [Acidobacteriota bacterium]
MSSLANNLLVFGRLLRRAGFDVPVGNLLDLIEALTLVDLRERDQVFHTCRALLVRNHDQLATFESAFNAFWRDHQHHSTRESSADAGSARTTARRVTARAGVAAPPDTRPAAGTDDQESPTGAIQTWSDAASLARKDIGEFSSDEIALARAALDRFAWIPGNRRTRRWVRGRGPRVDLRRAFGRILRTGGEVLTLPTRRRRVRPRPLVLLCDVSGSMERYSRMLLHFAHGVGQRHRKLEVFLFSTTITRVTRQVRVSRLDAAAAAVSGVVPDWSGGTRIGPALRQFHQRWSRRVLREGPVVLLISDGWDCGDPVLLRDEVARLQRSSYRLIWLNPLIGTLDYAPLTRGLQAALPFVDDFLPARTLADLGDLALHLNVVAARGRRGRPAPRPGLEGSVR